MKADDVYAIAGVKIAKFPFPGWHYGCAFWDSSTISNAFGLFQYNWWIYLLSIFHCRRQF